MPETFTDSPILNSPYEEPQLHYATATDGALNYQDLREGRRIFTPEITVIPEKNKGQQNAFDVNDYAETYGLHLINLIRKEISIWREAEYPDVTKVSLDLLRYWFLNPDRHETKQLFFAQREVLKVETVLEKRDQEIVYLIARDLIRYKFSDDENRPKYQLFNQLKVIVDHWYRKKVKLLNITDPEYRRLLYYDNPKTITDHIFKAINTKYNREEFIRPVFNHYNRFSSTKYVHGQTSKDVYPTVKSHVNYVVMDSKWEGMCAKTLEEIEEVQSYVKNQFLGFTIPYVKEGEDRLYYTDFIARVKTSSGEIMNLMIEITGMNKDKAEKKWYVENRWLPAINSVRDKYKYDRWDFIEIANDVRDIRNQLIDKIKSLK